MTLARITDHADRAVDRLPRQHRGRDNWNALLRALVSRHQGLEDALWTLVDERILDDATGAMLDVFGDLVGVARLGLDDDQYRLRIRVRIYLNKAAGRADDVLGVFRVLLGMGGPALEIRDFPPAAFELHVHDEFSLDLDEAVRVLRLARSGGVEAQLVYGAALDEDTFTFDGADGQGFDEGEFAGVADAG